MIFHLIIVLFHQIIEHAYLMSLHVVVVHVLIKLDYAILLTTAVIIQMKIGHLVHRFRSTKYFKRKANFYGFFVHLRCTFEFSFCDWSVIDIGVRLKWARYASQQSSVSGPFRGFETFITLFTFIILFTFILLI